ncbi:hypothetical protein ACFOWX_01440 [Sphingorhabdus arenilitoris]|uniref:Uncharacterized protein n=1 Tax=Sphingorhabdus arenilitoris TaxID=1490041 RepID=A0ABV8RFN8_9SPHN
MKIINSLAINQNSSPRLKSGEPSPSFAKLLENGLSAKDIGNIRARSFSESGILGQHYAVADKNYPLQASGSIANRSRNVSREAAQFSVAPEKQLVAANVLSSSRLSNQSTGGPMLGRVKAVPVHDMILGVADSFSFSPISPQPDLNKSSARKNTLMQAFDHQSSSSASFVTSFYHKKLDKPRMSLWGKNDALTVVFDEHVDNSRGSSEIKQLARQILFEFGVTNYQLLDIYRESF